MKLRRFIRLGVPAVCIALATTGCSYIISDGPVFHCPKQPGSGLAIAVGRRANSPDPNVPTEVKRRIATAMQDCATITVVRVDGRPSVVGALAFSTGARTDQNLQIDKTAFLNRVGALINSATALQPEANDLQALSVASGAAGPGGTVVLIDSGVQTADPLDFRKNNLPTRRAAAVVDALKQQRLLPSLSGRSVVLDGIGYTAAPQDALASKDQTFLIDLWRGIVSAAGAANPLVLNEPNTSGSKVNAPSVSVVNFPAESIQIGCDRTSVLSDSGEVGFVPNEANFRNPTAASAVLQKFASFLIANPTAQASIEGFVAHYGAGGALSQRRADRVKQQLISLGATNAITAKGMGPGPYPTPTAPPDPRYDQLNRQVTIRLTC